MGLKKTGGAAAAAGLLDNASVLEGVHPSAAGGPGDEVSGGA